VLVDGKRNSMRFPDGEFPIPVAQLEAESRWLEQFLTASVAEAIAVRPMLALPGWFVKRSDDKAAVYVFNPRNPRQLFMTGKVVLTPETMQRIAHQLDQLCRDVEARPPSPEAWPKQPGRNKAVAQKAR